MKRGFTLIELLAVIVVLAIISLIATPIILNIVENVKKSAVERSAEIYLNSVETGIARKLIQEPNYNYDGKYVVKDATLIPVTEDDNAELLALNMDLKGETPLFNSKVTIENGIATFAKLYYDDYEVIYSDGIYEVEKIVSAGSPRVEFLGYQLKANTNETAQICFKQRIKNTVSATDSGYYLTRKNLGGDITKIVESGGIFSYSNGKLTVINNIDEDKETYESSLCVTNIPSSGYSDLFSYAGFVVDKGNNKTYTFDKVNGMLSYEDSTISVNKILEKLGISSMDELTEELSNTLVK